MKIPKWLSTAGSFVIVGLVLSLLFVHHRAPPQKSAYTHALTIGTAEMHVAFAETPAEQEQGLSGTAPLAADEGMLFIFPSQNVIPFWMKEMNYSLDIIWIGEDMKVKDISADLAPASYPKTYASKEPIKYALEVNAGFSKKNNIAAGTTVVF